MGLSRWERCCEYIAPQWKRSLQHVIERRSTAPGKEEKSEETNASAVDERDSNAVFQPHDGQTATLWSFLAGRDDETTADRRRIGAY